MWWLRTLLNERGDVGGRQDREKEARRQEDVARQTEEIENVGNQFLAQLVPGSEEFNQFQAALQENVSAMGRGAIPRAEFGGASLSPQEFVRRLGQQLVQQQQARVAAGGPATALEARTEAAFEGVRRAAAFTPEEEDILRIQRGEAPVTALGRALQERIVGTPGVGGVEDELARALRGEPTTTPLGTVAQNIVGVAQQPPESLFEQELSLLQDRINREAQGRGLASSGIPLEQLGRAGVELAIAQAERRENIRRTREADVLDLLTRAQQGDQQAIQNLAALFETGQGLRRREIGVEEAATNLQLGRESRLTNLLQTQTGAATENLLGLLSAQTTRAESLRDVASALREAERQRLESFIYPEITVGIPGVVEVKKGGGGQATFAQAPSLATPGRTRAPAGTDVESLLAAERAPSTGAFSAETDLSQSLTRKRLGGKEEDVLAALLQAFGGGAG